MRKTSKIYEVRILTDNMNRSAQSNLEDLLKNTARRSSIAFKKSRLSLLPGNITIKTVCNLAEIDMESMSFDTCHFFPTSLTIQQICDSKSEFSNCLALETSTTLDEAMVEAGANIGGAEWENDCIVELSRQLVEKGLSEVFNASNKTNNKSLTSLKELGAAVLKVVMNEWEKWDSAILTVLDARLDDLVSGVSKENVEIGQKLEEAQNLLFVASNESNSWTRKNQRRARLNSCKNAINELEGEILQLEAELNQKTSQYEQQQKLLEYNSLVKAKNDNGKAGLESQVNYLTLKNLLSFQTTALEATRIAICLYNGESLPNVNFAWR